ncbi:MAG: helix-turn-helix transcriptional regulator [Thermodesulfobacteriota bacterium]
MIKKLFPSIRTNEVDDGPIEAGQTLGMPLNTVIERYLSNRNQILILLRIYSNLKADEVAKGLGVTNQELADIENGDSRVPFQWVPKLAKLFNVDLKALLTVLGHTRVSAADGTETRSTELPLAAQYSGPELSEQEKVDLKELVKMIIESARAKHDQE